MEQYIPPQEPPISVAPKSTRNRNTNHQEQNQLSEAHLVLKTGDSIGVMTFSSNLSPEEQQNIYESLFPKKSVLAIPRGGSDSSSILGGQPPSTGGSTSSKFGPGPRAQAKAREHVKRSNGRGSSILGPASVEGFAPRWTGSPRRVCTQQPEGLKCEDAIRPKVAHSLSGSKGDQSNGHGNSAKPKTRIVIDYEENDVSYSHRRGKTWARRETIEEDITTRAETPLEKYERMEDSIKQTVQNPSIVRNAKTKHFNTKAGENEKELKVYVGDNINGDEKFAVVVEPKTSVVQLATPINEAEAKSIESGILEFKDLRRDPQTWVINRKGCEEAESMVRAQEAAPQSFEGKEIRRPVSTEETNADFIVVNLLTGEKKPTDVVSFQGFGRQPLQTQIDNVVDHIKADNLRGVTTVCDMSELPYRDLKMVVQKKVKTNLTPEQIANTIFVTEK